MIDGLGEPASAAGLSAADVPRLKLKWVFGYPAGVSANAQPAIVSGRVTPDMFVIAKGSGAILERDIYPKTMALYPHPEGGGVVEAVEEQGIE